MAREIEEQVPMRAVGELVGVVGFVELAVVVVVLDMRNTHVPSTTSSSHCISALSHVYVEESSPDKWSDIIKLLVPLCRRTLCLLIRPSR